MKKILSLILSLFIVLTLCAGLSFAADKADEHPVTNVKVHASSINKNGEKITNPAEKAIDGDMATYWFTQITNPDPMPHYITLEYSSEIVVGGLRWYPRQDTPAGRISKFEVYLSNDNQKFQKVAEGTGNPSSQDAITVTFSQNYKAKFIRLQFTKTHGDYGSAAEVRALKATSGKSTASLNPTVTAASLSNGKDGVAGANGGAAGAGLGSEDEYPVTNVKVYTNSENKNGDKLTNPATKAIDGDTKTYWFTQITNPDPLPHYITLEYPSQIDMAGLRWYPRQDTPAGRFTQCEIYVSNDNVNFQKVAEAKGDPSSPNTVTILFDKTYKAKFIKFMVLKSHGDYGSAAEIRVLKPGAKATTTTTTTTTTATTTTTTSSAAAMATDEYDVTNCKVMASSENKNGDKLTNPAIKAVDGDMKTYWFSQITNPDPMPHHITIEYPSEIEVGGLRWYPRQDTAAGRIWTCEVYLSNDNQTFQKVADGKGDASKPDTITFTFDKNYKAKFIRLQFTKTHGDLAGAAEIRVLKPIAGKTTEAINPTIKAAALANGGLTGGSSGLAELPVTFWKATASSVNANNNLPAEVPWKAFDNNLKTHWQSRINPQAMPPHYIAIELPEIQAIGGLRYYPRPDRGVGIASKYEVWLSYDNVNYQKVAEGTWELNTDVKDIVFDKNYKTKFIRFRIIEGSINFGSAAEIRALVPDNKKETVLLNPTVKSSEIGGSENTGILECEAPTEIDETVLSLDEVSVKNMKLEVSSFMKGREPEKAIDGNVETWWFTQMEPEELKPPHYITMILPEATEVSGLRYYEYSKSPAGRCTKYEIYVSADGVNFERISYGQWENDKNNRAVYFPANIKVKAVKFVVLASHGNYGAAGEIRLVKGNPEKETIDAADFVAKTTKYNLVETTIPGIEFKANKETKYPFENMFDNDAVSLYQTVKAVGEDVFPVVIDFNLKGTYTLSGVRYQPSIDSDEKGIFKNYDLEYSLDGVNFTKIGSYEYYVLDYNRREAAEVFFDSPVTAKHFRITVNDALGQIVTIGEWRFLQTLENQASDLSKSGEKYVLKIGSNEIKVSRNGVETTVMTDVAPFIRNGSTLIPLRGLLEQMEAKVNWVDYDQKIEVVTQSGTYMLFQIESPRVMVDKVRHGLPVAPMIKDGRTFIPLRFVSENMGYNVSWNGETQEITITN